MTSFSIIGPANNSQVEAEAAAFAMVNSISDVDGVLIEPVVIEEGGTFVVRLIVTIPPDAKLDDDQKEFVERYTDIDEASEEFSEDFEQAEEGEIKDPVAEAVGAAATAQLQEDAITNDLSVEESQLDGGASPEEDLTINEDKIGIMDVDAAPEMSGATVATEQVKDEKPKQQSEKKVKPDLEPENV